MLTYLIPILYIILISILLKNRNVFIIFLSLIPIIMFSTYRGTMGADTSNYIKMFNDFNNFDSEFSFLNEPFFYILLFISKKISSNIEFFFFLNSTLVTFLYSLLISKFSLSRIFLLSVGPVFLIDTLTNGMRIGISYQILALGLILNTKNKRLTVLASLFHISSLFYFFYNRFINPIIEKINKKNFVLFLLCILMAPLVIVLVMNSQRILDKIVYYSSFQSPSILSGASDIYVILVVSLLSINRKCHISTYFTKLLTLTIIIVTFKIAAIYSYAILRLMKLMALSTIVYSSKVKSKSKLLDNNKFLFFSLLVPYTTNFILYIYRNPDLYL